MQSAVAQVVERLTGDQKVAGLEPHCWKSHCVVSLSKTLHLLLRPNKKISVFRGNRSKFFI